MEVMRTAYPHLRNMSKEVTHRGHPPGSFPRQHMWHFFETLVSFNPRPLLLIRDFCRLEGKHAPMPQIDPQTYRYLSEDFVFLKRWRDIGKLKASPLGCCLRHLVIVSWIEKFSSARCRRADIRRFGCTIVASWGLRVHGRPICGRARLGQ